MAAPPAAVTDPRCTSYPPHPSPLPQPQPGRAPSPPYPDLMKTIPTLPLLSKQTPPPSNRWCKCSPALPTPPNNHLNRILPPQGAAYRPSKAPDRRNRGSSSTREEIAWRTGSWLIPSYRAFLRTRAFRRESPRSCRPAFSISRRCFSARSRPWMRTLSANPRRRRLHRKRKRQLRRRNSTFIHRRRRRPGMPRRSCCRFFR